MLLPGAAGRAACALVLRHIYAFYPTKGIIGAELGTWISRGIVDKHSGSLRVRSSDASGRGGAVFTLFLPSEANL